MYIILALSIVSFGYEGYGGGYGDGNWDGNWDDCGNYDYPGNYKAAIYPYKIYVGDNDFCKSECDRESSCNGYSIDLSTNSCFLSSCNEYTSVTSCDTCYFASKTNPESTISCLPVTPTKPFTNQISSVISQPTAISQRTTNAQYTSLAQLTTEVQQKNLTTLSLVEYVFSSHHTSIKNVFTFSPPTTPSERSTVAMPTTTSKPTTVAHHIN